jgi:hypothetical protein
MYIFFNPSVVFSVAVSVLRPAVLLGVVILFFNCGGLAVLFGPFFLIVIDFLACFCHPGCKFSAFSCVVALGRPILLFASFSLWVRAVCPDRELSFACVFQFCLPFSWARAVCSAHEFQFSILDVHVVF